MNQKLEHLLHLGKTLNLRKLKELNSTKRLSSWQKREWSCHSSNGNSQLNIRKWRIKLMNFSDKDQLSSL